MGTGNKRGKILFAGDTGTLPISRNQRKAWADALALLPIGDIGLVVHEDHTHGSSGCRVRPQGSSGGAIHCHAWGTFQLTDEPLGEPPLYLKKAMKRRLWRMIPSS